MRISLLSITLMGTASLSITTLGQDVFPTRPSEVPNPPTAEPVDTADQVSKNGAAPEVKESPAAGKLPDGEEDPVSEHIIASGDSLTAIAAKGYGRAGYWRVLKLYNDCEPSKLTIGQVIRIPELEWLLEEEGVIPLFEDAATAMMQAQSLFIEAEDAMEEQGVASPDEETAAKISEARKLLARARELFSEKREGVTELPNSVLLQLRTAGELMGQVAAKTGNAETKMAEVHERLGNALTYCVIWAREGFN